MPKDMYTKASEIYKKENYAPTRRGRLNRSQDMAKHFRIPRLMGGSGGRADGTMSDDGKRRYDAATKTWKIVR